MFNCLFQKIIEAVGIQTSTELPELEQKLTDTFGSQSGLVVGKFFLLSDGKIVHCSNYEHEESAKDVGTSLTDLLDSGVIRGFNISGYMGYEISKDITITQKQIDYVEWAFQKDSRVSDIRIDFSSYATEAFYRPFAGSYIVTKDELSEDPDRLNNILTGHGQFRSPSRVSEANMNLLRKFNKHINYKWLVR